jgi:hypothetical protein
MTNALFKNETFNQNRQWFLVKIINGLKSNGTFNQDSQRSLVKCNMVYYLIYLPPTYSPS